MKKEDQEFVELVRNFADGLEKFNNAHPVNPDTKVGCFFLADCDEAMQTAVYCTGEQLYVMLRQYLTKSPKSLEVVNKVLLDVIAEKLLVDRLDPDCEA